MIVLPWWPGAPRGPIIGQCRRAGKAGVAPRAKIGVLAASSLRVEPYKQPFKVLPHEVGTAQKP